MKLHGRGLPVFAVVMPLLMPATGCRRAEEMERPQQAPTEARASIVGHRKCAVCHAEIAELHAASGHSKTFSLAKDSQQGQLLCGKSLDGKEPFGMYEYVCDQEGLAVSLPARFKGRLMPLDLALGSGAHAVTFVSLSRDKAGKPLGIEHHMTWYASDAQFDITPGQEDLIPVSDGAYFGKFLDEADLRNCVGCHTTTATVAGTQLENLYGGVQCERCHGSASLHVAAAERGDKDAARRLMNQPWSASDQIKQCGKCHRTVDDIKPERLERYPKSVVRFQPVGLSKSRCFSESQGELKCTTCHDPHARPATRTLADQVATCVKCHQRPEHEKCPVSPAADCIRCHMPAIDLVRGIKFHDHWIRVRQEEPPDDGKAGGDAHSVLK